MTRGTRSAAVFLTPAADDYRYAEGLIRELSAKLDAPLFEPHLTLCSGVTAEPGLLIRVVAEAARGLAPLTLRVRRIGCTEEYFRSIFIEFEPDPVLAGLHERLGELLERRDSAVFLPHLSLLYLEMPLADKQALTRRLRLDRRVLRFDGLKVVAPGNAEAGWRDTLRWEALFRVALSDE
ncbi:MAG: hypothetical protein NDI77_04170 [Geobacteraceae bacterium]|nr:hypothetical protein [Geobacteraceae bacterium]